MGADNTFGETNFNPNLPDDKEEKQAIIQLMYKTPHYRDGWAIVYARSIPEAFEELQQALDKTMKNNSHIAVYEISEIRINYYRKDPREN